MDFQQDIDSLKKENLEIENQSKSLGKKNFFIFFFTSFPKIILNKFEKFF